MGPCGMILLVLSSLLVNGLESSNSGDFDPIYRSCVDQCEKTGCIEELCFPNCNYRIEQEKAKIDVPWYFHESLLLKWTELDCRCHCRYHCTISREDERAKTGEQPVKYHGRWPFRRIFGVQEPVSVALSTLNLGFHFHGCLLLFIVVQYKLPLRQNGNAFYRFAGLCYVYGFLAINSSFWTAVFHARYMDVTERLHYSSKAVLNGYSLILAILRAFNIRAEASRVIIAAPILSFLTTHVLYLNLTDLNYVWTMAVEVVLFSGQLVFWSIWAARVHQQLQWKLWAAVVVGVLHTFLQIYDFAPYEGLVDAHGVCQAISVVLTYLFWSVFRDDARFTTMARIKKAK